jgi:hypothetical protein
MLNNISQENFESAFNKNHIMKITLSPIEHKLSPSHKYLKTEFSKLTKLMEMFECRKFIK